MGAYKCSDVGNDFTSWFEVTAQDDVEELAAVPFNVGKSNGLTVEGHVPSSGHS